MRSIFAPAKQKDTDVFKGKATFLEALRNKSKKVLKKLFGNKKGCMFAAAKKGIALVAKFIHNHDNTWRKKSSKTFFKKRLKKYCGS